MNSKMTQAWIWLSAGVLAAGLNAVYHDGGAAQMREIACRIADRVVNRVIDNSERVVARTADRADHLLTLARLTVREDESVPCRYKAVVPTLQARLDGQRDAEIARVNLLVAHKQAQLARVEADRDRVEAVLTDIRIPNVEMHISSCPRIRVNVPRIPEVHVQVPNVRIPAPEIQIDNSMSDPI